MAEQNRSLKQQRGWSLARLVIALLCMAGGIVCLTLDMTANQDQSCRGIAGLFLVLCGTVQFGLPARSMVPVLNSRMIASWTLACIASCYLIALCIGPREGLDWLFFSMLAIAFTTMLWSTTTASGLAIHIRNIANNHATKRTVFALSLGILILIVTETSLRVINWATCDRLAARFFVLRVQPTPGETFQGQLINAQGFVGNDFEVKRQPRVFRIAVLGDELTISGGEENNFIRLLDRQQPDVEILNFSMPQAGPREYSALLSHHVARYNPDLVLCFLSVADDIYGQSDVPGIFDWRGLQLSQFASHVGAYLPEKFVESRQQTNNYLAHRGQQLSICRSPISSRISDCWLQTQSHLNALAQQCSRRDLPLALVLIPADFQVNEVLLKTLQRRMAADQVDIGLPQRRLVQIARKLNLPVLDLLPQLKASTGPTHVHRQNQLSDRGHLLLMAALEPWIERSYGRQILAIAGRPQGLAAEARPAILRR